MDRRTDDGLSNSGKTYRGPIIVARLGPALNDGVWIANGTRALTEVFVWPGPLPTFTAPTRTPLDDIMDRFIDSVRSGSLADELNAEELERLEAEEFDDNEPESLDEIEVTAVSETVNVLVLGPVEISGWKEMPDRLVVTELACYLALREGRWTAGDDLRVALWPDVEREASGKSLRNYMSLLRKALGAEHVPGGTGAGYRLGANVVTDWSRFKNLAERESDVGAGGEALNLIRGRPFAGVPSNSYGWVYSELLLSEMEVMIIDIARRVATSARAAGDLMGAGGAIRQGLLAVPNDFGLWEELLAVTGRMGRDHLERACRDAEATLGADAAELVAVAWQKAGQ